jgi:hypothetical protein
MAQTEDFVTDKPNRGAGRGRSSEEIQSEIDRTRADMDETFAALDAKLTPGQIGVEAWHMVKEGSRAGAGKLWRLAREHPMPAAVIGLGVGWLLVESARHGDGRAEERIGDATEWTREKASDLGQRAKGRAAALKGKARAKTRRAKLGFWQSLEENPLLVGTASLALGLIAGLSVPSTDKEDELWGGTRDRLLDEVKEAGQEVLDKGKHVAEAVADKAKLEAKNQGLTPEGVAERVKTVAREAANAAKEEARNQNLTPEGVLDRAKQAAGNVRDVHQEEPEPAIR